MGGYKQARCTEKMATVEMFPDVTNLLTIPRYTSKGNAVRYLDFFTALRLSE